MPGVQQIVLAAEDHLCRDTAIHQVMILGHPQIDFTANQAGCAPWFVQFNTQADSAFNHLVFALDFGNGLHSSDVSPATVYAQSGLYDVQLIVYATGGCRDTLIIYRPGWITVYPKPIASFSVSPPQQSIFTPHFQFADHSVLSDSCVLYFGDGAFSNLCTLSHSYEDTGHYQAVQMVYTSHGCADTAVVPVIVYAEYTSYIPNSFTPNGDGINDVFTAYGVGWKAIEVQIYNRWGEKINGWNIIGQGWDGRDTNGAKCESGVYVYRISVLDFANRERDYWGRINLIR